MRTHSGFALTALLIPLGLAVAAMAGAMAFKVGNTDLRSKAADPYQVFKTWTFEKSAGGWMATGNASVAVAGGALKVTEKPIRVQPMGMDVPVSAGSAASSKGGVSRDIAPIYQGMVVGIQNTAVSAMVVPGRIGVRVKATVSSPVAEKGGIEANSAASSAPGKSGIVSSVDTAFRNVPMAMNVEYQTSANGPWLRGQAIQVPAATGVREYVVNFENGSGVSAARTVTGLRLTWPSLGGITGTTGRTISFSSIQLVGERPNMKPTATPPSKPTGIPGNCRMTQVQCIKAPCPEIMVCDTPVPQPSCVPVPVCPEGMMCTQQMPVLKPGQVYCPQPTAGPKPGCRYEQPPCPKGSPCPAIAVMVCPSGMPVPTPMTKCVEGSGCFTTECGNSCPPNMACAQVCTRVEGRCVSGTCVPYPKPTVAKTSCSPEGSKCTVGGGCTSGPNGLTACTAGMLGVCQGGACVIVRPTPIVRGL
jgi:hypothetical protein